MALQQKTLPQSDKLLIQSNRSDGIYGTYTVPLPSDDLYYLPFDVMVGMGNAFGRGPNSSIETIYSSEGSKSTSCMTLKEINFMKCDNRNKQVYEFLINSHFIFNSS